MAFRPIRTDRLLLRRPELGDVDAVYERRSHPDVARYQDWQMPYEYDRAVRATSAAAALDGPQIDSGWMVTVVEAAAPERIVGDLYVELRWGGRSGYVGFSFHPDFWGRGYATEAAHALIAYLFHEVGVGRIESSLHPDNVASARVLEACGLLFEGLTRESFWVGDTCSDDMLYGMTRRDWEAWRDRPRQRPERVELIEITGDNRRVVCELATHRSQERFVAPMLINLGDIVAPPSHDGTPLVPWYRAITADGEIAGFIMAAGVTGSKPNPYLWRLLVDRMQQRRGVASAALDRFEEGCREQGATAIEVSWVEGPGSPAPMYRARGYEPSGRIEHGEIHAVKQLR